jgi:hypothetical protein
MSSAVAAPRLSSIVSSQFDNLVKRWAFILSSLVLVWAALFVILRSHQPTDVDLSGYQPTPKRLSDASRHLLDSSDQFILLSLEPVYLSDPQLAVADKRERFHDYPVLGSLRITNATQKSELLAALYKGVMDSDGSVASCFDPRHGIKATTGTNWIDLVICFECSYMKEYGSAPGGGATTTKSPSKAFNRALREAGVPITTK